MIFDSEQQKNFVLDCVRKYPTDYQTALNCANAFGEAIQTGRIIDVKEQLKALPMPQAPKAPAEVNKDEATKPSDNGNGPAKTEQPHDYTKGPAPE